MPKHLNEVASLTPKQQAQLEHLEGLLKPKEITFLESNAQDILLSCSSERLAADASGPRVDSPVDVVINRDFPRTSSFGEGSAEFQENARNTANQKNDDGLYPFEYLQGDSYGASGVQLLLSKMKSSIVTHYNQLGNRLPDDLLDSNNPIERALNQEKFHTIQIMYRDDNKVPCGIVICVHKTKPNIFYIAHVRDTLQPARKDRPMIAHFNFNLDNDAPSGLDTSTFQPKLIEAINCKALTEFLHLNNEKAPLFQKNHLHPKVLNTLTTVLEHPQYHPFGEELQSSWDGNVQRNKEIIEEKQAHLEKSTLLENSAFRTEKAHIEHTIQLLSELCAYAEYYEEGLLLSFQNQYIKYLDDLERATTLPVEKQQVAINDLFITLAKSLSEFDNATLDKALEFSKKQANHDLDRLNLNFSSKILKPYLDKEMLDDKPQQLQGKQEAIHEKINNINMKKNINLDAKEKLEGQIEIYKTKNSELEETYRESPEFYLPLYNDILQEIKNREEQIKLINKENTHLDKIIENYTHKLNAVNAAADFLQYAADNNIDCSSEAMRFFLEENEKINSMKQELYTQKTKLESRLVALQSDPDATAERVRSTEEKITALTVSLLSIEQAHRHFIDTSLSALKQPTPKQIFHQKAQLNQQRIQLEGKINQHAINCADLVTKIKTINDKNYHINQCIPSAEDKDKLKEPLESQLKEKSAQKEALKTQLKEIEQQIAKLESLQAAPGAPLAPSALPVVKTALAEFCHVSARTLQNDVLKNEKTKEHDSTYKPKATGFTGFIQRIVDSLLDTARRVLSSAPEHGTLTRNKTRSVAYDSVKKLSKLRPKQGLLAAAVEKPSHSLVINEHEEDRVQNSNNSNNLNRGIEA